MPKTDSIQALAGLWAGEYGYSHSDVSVPFSAWFEIANGKLYGTTLEPNTFGDPDLEELEADINGHISALSLSFVKQYVPAPDVHQNPIGYSGSIGKDFTEINGVWHIHDGPFYVDGTFQLRRVLATEAISNRTAAKQDTD